MAIDLRLIKRKWKFLLLGWVLLLIVSWLVIFLFATQSPPVLDTAMGENIRAEGNFGPGGNIVFSMRSVKSINGWHKSTIRIIPRFTRHQEHRGLARIIRSLTGNFSDGIFGIDDIPSYQLKQKLIGGVEEPVLLKMDFLLPDNETIIGETVVFEMECDTSYPYLVGKDKYSVNNKTSTGKVKIHLKEASSSSTGGNVIGYLGVFFVIFWWIGIVMIYKKIKKDPY